MSRTLRSVLIFLGVILLLALGGVASVFLVQNSRWVTIRFPGLSFSWDAPFPMVEFETPLAVIIAAAFALGFVTALLLLVIPGWIGRGVERQRERRFIRGLEGELTDLRNLPVTSPAPLEDVPEEPMSSPAAVEAPEDEERALLAAALQAPEREGR